MLIYEVVRRSPNWTILTGIIGELFEDVLDTDWEDEDFDSICGK